jgi:hypothetical protein
VEFFFLVFLWLAVAGLFSWIFNLNHQFNKMSSAFQKLNDYNVPDKVRVMAEKIDELNLEIDKIKLIVGPKDTRDSGIGDLPDLPPIVMDSEDKEAK